MKKIGILCASDTELAPFLKQIRQPRVTEKAMLSFYEGKIGRREIVAAYSGVCKVNAAIAVQVLLDRFQVEAVFCAGTAGGMDPKVQVMDTVIPDRMLYHDVAEDILTEFHPWIQENAFSADPKLLAAARRYSRNAVFPIWFGTAVTGEAFVGNERREELNRRYHPLSVDMETAAMAHVCYVNQIPFLCVRTITDTEEHQGMEYFEKNCQDASARAAEVVMGILEEMESSG